jgi:hypothetical protein
MFSWGAQFAALLCRLANSLSSDLFLPEMEILCSIAVRMMARVAEKSKVHPLPARSSELSESRACRRCQKYFLNPLLSGKRPKNYWYGGKCQPMAGGERPELLSQGTNLLVRPASPIEVSLTPSHCACDSESLRHVESRPSPPRWQSRFLRV